jgi:hypothetical protein
MGGVFIGAYFFIPPDRRPSSDDELFQMLGGDLVRSSFGPLSVADRGSTLLSDHACAYIYFLKSELIDVISRTHGEEVPLDRDPLLPLAMTLRDGAARLAAEVAFLETRSPELESVLDRYWMVQARDATSLAAEWLALLYMDELMVKDWDPGPILLDRDELPGGPGRTLFASRGRNRWF